MLLGWGIAGAAYGQQFVGPCSVLPPNNIWNTPVDTLPLLSNSTAMVNTIGASRGFHADFGSGTWNGGPIGIPFITVTSAQPAYPASFRWPGESDPGPYRVPLDSPIEGGPNAAGDRHTIAIDTDRCVLYELYRAFPQASAWTADSGSIFDLKSNALRPSTWTSADAAGLPIMPGLVTYDEVLSGEIRHAIRFTVPESRREFVWPARHYASSLTGPQYPRMGERFRLKASFDVSPYPAAVQVILRAMKKYGIIMADNGSAWYISGKPDPRWNNDHLQTLGQLLGSNFEAVDATVLMIDPNSGEARQSRKGLGDFDADGRTDLAVFRPNGGNWFVRYSTQSYNAGMYRLYQWGLPGDRPVPSDFDGDRRMDLAVFRPASGEWFVRDSSQNFGTYRIHQWGLNGDTPLATDFDGDWKADLCVFRPSTGQWFIRYSTQGYNAYGLYQWGLTGDIPLATDFDGDGKTDITVFRPSTGQWFVRYSSQGFNGYALYQWGLPGDIPLAADFDGDGKTDLVVFRPSTGQWFVRYSSQSYSYATQSVFSWGLPGDVPMASDFDGDGKSELTVFRPNSGEWHLRYSSQNFNTSGLYQWGLPGDIPLPSR
jgi:hypothetical protein